MSVRKPTSRTTTNYIIFTHNDIRYFIEPETYQPKSLIYQAKAKLMQGKIVAPSNLVSSGKTILVICNGGGKFTFSHI